MISRRYVLGWLCAGAATAAMPGLAADESSSMIRSIAYDAATQTLTVVMAKDGRTYRHLRVPEKVYRDFQASKSKGTFYLLHIKGRYEFSAQ
jgi:hypothetical protein